MSSFSLLHPAVRRIWAKSGEAGGHGLLAHLLDVAAVAEVILRLEPPATHRMAARSMGLREADVLRWVAALVGLHDFGKAIPGFQAKWEAGQLADRQAGLSFEPAASLECDQHSRATAALLSPMLQTLCGAEFLWCLHGTQAVSAHHGYHFSAHEVANGAPRREPPAWRQARSELLEAYWAVLAPPGCPEADAMSLPLVNWLAGLTSAADWIASNPTWFPPGERHDDLAMYHQHALQLAEQALRRVGWRAWRPLLAEVPDVAELLPRMIGRADVTVRPLQREGDVLLRSARGPSLLLVEAPMGEGKTELAFLAHLHLQAANEHRGLYLALPTQATGNALFKRAQTFLEAFATAGLDLQLVHGGAEMNEDLTTLRGIDHSPSETLSASTWFGQRRRPLLSPHGVGTVDQALYAVLNVKHHFVRLWGLSNRVIVLDEVHAYDTYTSGLIVALLRWLRSLDCSVVLMSATLPHARRRDLLTAWGVDQILPEPAYPRLMLADATGVKGVHVDPRPLAPIEVQGMGCDINSLADVAIAQLREGGCGASIVNTVARAQALYRALQERLRDAGLAGDTSLLLFHARFPADERRVLEERVLSLFGPHGQRPPRALLVATQVAEQSLDIDFDFMFSDLAPIDLLLQRAGRLHRHLRDSRPTAHAVARLWVAGLQPGQLPELEQTAWGFVYEPYLLCRTWALLTQEPVLNLPHDIDRLVQAVYDDDHELPDDVEVAMRRFIEIDAYGEYLADRKTQEQLAQNIAIHPAEEAQLAYDHKPRGHEEDEQGVGPTNVTRLGQPSITLIPVMVDAEGRWHVREGDSGFDPNSPVDPPTARALYGRQIKAGRRWVFEHFNGQEPPVAFAQHALLRHARAVPLTAGTFTLGNRSLSLSAELGLVYGDEGGASAAPSASPR